MNELMGDVSDITIVIPLQYQHGKVKTELMGDVSDITIFIPIQYPMERLSIKKLK